MQRDVVLDIIFTKMIGAEYMAGMDELANGCRELDAVENALVVKGLLRRYANAMNKGHIDEMQSISQSLGMVSKAMEIFNYTTGQREVQTHRDSKGRFSRFLANQTYSGLPTAVEHKRGRKQTDIAVASPEMVDQIRQGMQTNPNEMVGDSGMTNRQMAEQRSGKVRAINRFQDELLDIFGPEAGEDVVVVLENIVTGPGQEQEQQFLALNEPVNQEALNIAENQQGARMSMGLRESAAPQTRQKYQQLDQLLESGLRPDVAADLVGTHSGKASGAARNMADKLMGYSGQKPSSTANKAKRHFDTMDALADYMSSSKVPQLAAAGGALKTAAKLGGGLNEEHYKLAERMNYRFRGRKDRLPQLYSESMATPQHQALEGLANDASLTPESWRSLKGKLRASALEEKALSTNTKTGGVSFSDPVAAEVDYLDRKLGDKASPRNYVDRFTRDMAVTSMVPEVPADKRAVMLGEKAGFGVPSSGMIIRADGKAKEMYRGVADDHYLPFSAKALPELRDGQYVRTRALGGLTPEDITTIVSSGGRRATVVSASGIYSIELRPDVSLEGRLKSPEVAAMGERYERILDQVSESGMYVRDLPPDVMEELRISAAKTTGAVSGDTAFDTRLDKLKAQKYAELSELTADDITAIREQFSSTLDTQNIGGRSPQQRAEIKNGLIEEAIADAKEEKVRRISLNDEGYSLAMDTLRLQYPDIIRRVEHQRLKDFVNDRNMGGVLPKAAVDLRSRRGAPDTGLVRPGESRAHTKEWSSERAARENKKTQTPGTAAGSLVPAAGRGGAAATAAGAAGAAAVAAAPAGGQPGQVDIPAIRGAMGNKHDDAVKEASTLVSDVGRGVVVDDAIADKSGKFTPQMLTDALDEQRAGLGVRLSSTVPPAVMLKSHSSVVNATKSPQGLTVLMTLAYGAEQPGDEGWAGAFMDGALSDPSSLDHKRAALALDALASAAIARESYPHSKPLTGGKELGFYVPPDVMAVVPEVIEDGGGAKVIADIEAAANDTVTQEGKDRVQAKEVINGYISSNKAFSDRLSHGQGIAGDPVSELSLLGLLAAQSEAVQYIDRIKTSADDKKGLADAFDDQFFARASDPAELAANKERLRTAVQGMFGAEYLRRMVGGGDVGPKVLGLDGIVAKSFQQQVDLLLQQAQELPQQEPLSHLQRLLASR